MKNKHKKLKDLKEEDFDLSKERKEQISKAVKRVLKEHKETFKKLSKE